MHRTETLQENRRRLGSSNREYIVRSTKRGDGFTSRSSASTGTRHYCYLVLSLGRLCDELGNSNAWQPGENPEHEREERRPPHAALTTCTSRGELFPESQPEVEGNLLAKTSLPPVVTDAKRQAVTLKPKKKP